MDVNLDEARSLSLVYDLLSDMIVNYFALKAHRVASPEVRETVLAFVENQTDEEMDHELTVELLGTPYYRVVA